MVYNRQFCYTLDVLTDGSEYTGCGTLFLSVWKIPLSIRSSAIASDSSDDSLTVPSDSDDDSSSLESDSDGDSYSDEEKGEKEAPQQTKASMDTNSDHEIPGESPSDQYSWLTGTPRGGGSGVTPNAPPTERHTPVARYAISGVGDATARLCADQRFGLAPTRACFVPVLGGASAAADGLSALFLALHGAGAPSLHVVVPSRAGRCANAREEGDSGGFVEELATTILGAHKKLDIRTCEIREQNGSDDHDSITWWKVYEDGHLIVHACSNASFLSSSEGNDRREYESERGSTSTSLTFLYSFPTLRLRNGNRILDKNPYCTLALFPPRYRNVADAYQRLMGQNLPMIRDGIPMKSIDYVVFLSPDESFSFAFDGEKTEESRYLTPAKNSQILMTLPRNQANPQNKDCSQISSKQRTLNDEGILIRSQQLHRYFHSSIPSAFAEPRSQILSDLENATERKTNNGYLVLKSGTSIVLEKMRKKEVSLQKQSKSIAWDRRGVIWTKKLKDEWTRPIFDSLQSFLHPKTPAPVGMMTPTTATDENEIELDDEIDTEEEDSKEPLPTNTEDENEIDLDDEDEDASSVGTEEAKARQLSISVPAIKDKVRKRAHNGEEDSTKETSTVPDSGPRLLVLGTGCATPSAYRGASGYALILPSSNQGGEFCTVNQPYCSGGTGGRFDPIRRNSTSRTHDCKKDSHEIYLLDCGEGVSTMLSRNSGHINDWVRRVRGIWISHAHLDHYGGLPTLLRLLSKERESLCSPTIQTKTKSTEHRFSKRPRRSSNGTLAPFGCSSNHNEIYDRVIPVPWVVAHAKVLRYLDLILDCRNGRSKDGHKVCFEPRLHHDPRQPPKGTFSPFFHFESIRVQHNCCPAYGLLVGWKKVNNAFGGDHGLPASRERSNTSPCDHQFLCYSGDTRPSKNLVQACERALRKRNAQMNQNGIRYFENRDESNADVFLIHEATFRDTEATMAHKKKHSTVREALMVATDIPCCSRVLLTHFSQRYDNIPSSPSEMASGPPTLFEANHIKESPHANGTDCNSSSSWRTKKNNDKFRNTNIDPPSIGLAMDGLWISLK